jgi:glycosyltransferase involved in cell wall biosynthesis
METFRFLFTTSFYPPYHLGGDAIHVKCLAEELARKGNEVHILHSIDAYRVKRNNYKLLKQEPDPKNIFVHRIESPLERIDPLLVHTLGSSFYVQKKFSEVLKKVHPDVVHHHNISLLGYSILKKQIPCLSLYTAHDYWLICSTNNLLRNKSEVCNKKLCYSCSLKSNRFPQFWRHSKSFRRAVNNLDLLIFPCDYVRKRITEEMAVKSITLPNFASAPPKNISTSEFSEYFLFVGMLEKHKGILNLINLFKGSRHEIKARLIIVGEGSLSHYIRDFIEKNSLNDKISFLGFVDNKRLYSLFSNALALIIPSIWPENAPLVALEALSVGTPIIVSNKGGLPEIINKVNLNLVFDNFNQLKEILINFSKKTFSRSEIKRISEENFSPQAYVKNYIEELNLISS